MPQRPSSRLLRRVRLGASTAALRAASFLARGASRVADLASAFAAHAVDRDDRGALTATIYRNGAVRGRSGLFPWEETWLVRDLPPPPASLLLGGTGRGREARWLASRGYTVIAFDPSRESVAFHRASCPQVECVVLDYESLARASQAERSGAPVTDDAAALVLSRAPYDVALLGWGSLSHVLEERDHDALFESLAALVPSGPILASFLLGSMGTRGRAGELGARLGSALGPAPNGVHAETERVRCSPHHGFAYSFDAARLEQLARCAARRLELHLAAGSYPHATFR